jgi:ubiquinone/menaquinone biosynthesis C-methylase UbiE
MVTQSIPFLSWNSIIPYELFFGAMEMDNFIYLMESENETYRLDMKTCEETVQQQALWAGIKPGMRVADLGFGSGKTTYTLNKLVQPGGEVIGVDYAADRIEYAKKKYCHETIKFIQRDIRESLADLGTFDFIWIRFVLEYHRADSFEITKNASKILRPEGILQLIDLDHNCLCHYGLSQSLEKTLFEIMDVLQKYANFDPYVGRKLYSYLYDLGFDDISVSLSPHHLIYGELGDIDIFNWVQKAKIAAKKYGLHSNEKETELEDFYEEFMTFFRNPRRLTYTPLLSCKGKKPEE